MFYLIVFSLLTMVLTQSTMYAIMFNYCATIMHILYSTMLDYNVSIMHILYSRVISFSHMFCFLLYFLTKLFCIATCSSISNYLKLTMFHLYQCLNYYNDTYVNLFNDLFLAVYLYSFYNDIARL